jgi:transcriptional regulator with XRE-family HTH domain
MDIYTLSDKAIEHEIGAHLKNLRLQKNLTQEQLSKKTVLSLNTIKSLEAGRGKISTLIALLRELKALDRLNSLTIELSISPLQLALAKNKTRKRATGKKRKS